MIYGGGGRNYGAAWVEKGALGLGMLRTAVLYVWLHIPMFKKKKFILVLPTGSTTLNTLD